MVQKYALIVNGVVDNIILWDGATQLGLDGILVLVEPTVWCDIGFLYNVNLQTNSGFLAPEVE